MGAVGFSAILWLYSKVFKQDGSEFNRLDGMLRFKRRFRRLFVAPFDEFDPVLQLLPSGYGSHDYALWLHHRYTDNKVWPPASTPSVSTRSMPWPSGTACNATWT